ncbi:RagB/SusD family nutrient uptake outer membrane protein [Flavicella sp.]|uniref:RagB/SusD family nutrient uptake outer membrane protein n=1 Tax=Flavicella sp. TaxID=2957742 RepID=UPI002614BFA7|nr:RagB/SusD family nutrient uptake outer membrane protein [Flavicella sp.]MDG1803537.1 RagB/SusD family nutrient uptake outer membrane protein [Flavicella sp.]MDG2279040.1 RagB/SusD family nutrient uptake outer membrane protein [Flavicella sp.]
MKNYKIYITGFIIAFVTLTACSDDFIDVPSRNPNSDDFFKTEQDYQDVLIGVYDLLQASFWNVMVGEIASDNTLAGGDPDNIDGPSIQDIDNMVHNDVNEQLRDIWRWMYAGLNRANYMLEFRDNIEFDTKNDMIGQALFLRAYFTFELAKWFGPLPLLVEDGRIQNKRMQFGEQFTISRTATIADTYALIEADLIEAVSLLNTTQDLEYKVTKGAAQSLLGKVYLYHGTFDAAKYTDAATVLDQVISDGNYTLASNFGNIFEHPGENADGSIFEVQYTDVEGAGFDCLQCSEGNVAVGFSGVREYVGPTFDSGYGFNTPTAEAASIFTVGDLRKDATIFDAEAIATSYQPSRGETKLYNRKYLPRKGDLGLGDNNLTNPNNYRAIRYADILLMAAEANIQKAAPDATKAKGYLDLVRDRAFGNTTNRIDATLANILQERRLELMGEGHRFFDLVRTGNADSTIDGFVANKNELFPIPLIELELAGAVERWGQNPGY